MLRNVTYCFAVQHIAAILSKQRNVKLQTRQRMARVRVRVRVTARVTVMLRNAALCYILLRNAEYRTNIVQHNVT